MSMSDQMDLSFGEKDGVGGGGFFDELTILLGGMLAKPPKEDELKEVAAYLGQTTEALRSGQFDNEPGAVNEIFLISSMSARLCLRFDEFKTTGQQNEAILSQLKDIFYKANELFTTSLSLCTNRSNITVTKLGEILDYVKSCQKLDIKLFFQASKSFLPLIDTKRAVDFAQFLQTTIFSDFLAPTKRTATSIKVTGFMLKNLTNLYANFGPDLLASPEQREKTARFLVDLHAVYLDFSKLPQSELDTLTNSYGQFVIASLQQLFLPLLRHESFLSTLIELNLTELSSSSKTAWICLIVNVFSVMSDSNTISQHNEVQTLLETFLRNFCEWAVDEVASQQWPWPVIGSLKPQTASELCAYSAAKLVLRSTLEEASCFFLFEQLLILALTGKSGDSPPYPVMARLLISDIVTFMTKSSQRLAIRYISIFSEFVAKTAENDEATTILVPFLLRRIFDTISDDQRAKIVEQAIDELVRSFPNLIQSKRQNCGVYSMSEAFRMLELCVNALLTAKGPVNPLLTVTVRLFAFLTWWTASSPEMLKSCRNLLEKTTFSMWQILSMLGDDTGHSSLVVLMAQAVFEASKAAIIGVNNYETSARFWQAAGQFVEIASLPQPLKQLFVVWLLKVVDTTTLAASPGAQKVLENCLISSSDDDDLLHGVVLANLASRLKNTNNNNNGGILATRLTPKLRIQAEAFSQQLFCIPFSKL